MKAIWKGVLYAIAVNLIIVSVPIAVGLLDIAQSSRPSWHTFVYSKFHGLARDLACYSVVGCSSKLAYAIFLLEWIILTAIVYAISIWRSYSVPDRKQLLIGFVVAFPIASYAMSQLMIMILAISKVLKFGFV